MAFHFHTFTTTTSAVVIAVLATSCTATTDDTTPGEQSSSGREISSARVEVSMNHCWVEPVAFDGELWNVPFDRQFGWGGMQPRHWEGAGVMTRVSEDRARFQDDGGATVGFRPVDDLSVLPVESALCR